MRVAIVCDNRPEAGRGHVSRMTAMLEEGQRRGHVFDVFNHWKQTESGIFGAVIVDDYRVTRSELTMMGFNCGRVVVFDDWQPERCGTAWLIVSPGGSADMYAPLGVRALTGFDYAPIRKEFVERSRRQAGVAWCERKVEPQTIAESALFGLSAAAMASRLALMWANGDTLVTSGGQLSLEASLLDVRQRIEPTSLDVSCNVERLARGERPDGHGADRVWDAIERP